MRKMKYLGILPIIVLILAACAPATTETATAGAPVDSVTSETQTTEPLTTGTPVVAVETTEATRAAETPTTGATTSVGTPAAGSTSAVGTPAAGATTTVGTPGAGIPVTGPGTINVRVLGDYGPVLVNEDGFALYIFKNDRQYSGASSCINECTSIWPPLLTEGPAEAGEDVDSLLLGTLPRDDGTTQVTYNGWPLYLYHGDRSPGDTNGHGVTDSGGRWYLVTPDGNPL